MRLLLLCGAFFAFFSFYDHFILPRAELLTKNAVLTYANSCINKAVETAARDAGNDLKSICDIKYASDGSISSITADGIAVNRFCGITADELSKMLESGQSTVYINLGSFTGIPFLSDKGPPVPVNIGCTGGVTANYAVDIKNAGINQVSFGLYINIHTDIHTYNPLINSIISLDRRVMLAHTVYAGAVPEAYGTAIAPALNEK